MKMTCHKIVVVCCSILLFVANGEAQNRPGTKWVGTWSTAPQLIEERNNPPSPGLSNNTLRQIVHLSIGGDSLRIRFTNEFSKSSITLKEVHIALSKGGGFIDTTTDQEVLFHRNSDVTIDAGDAIISDAVHFSAQPLSDIAITIYYGNTSPDITGHPGSRTTSYILPGDHVTQSKLSNAVSTDHWYTINTIDVKASDSSFAVAILGNSITDGRGSGTNKQNRWPDELSRRFQIHAATKNIGVLNKGIGGNCVLGNCLGPSALSRFERDIIQQSGVKWVIVYEGINDIGYGDAGVGNNLINAYKQMISLAHLHGYIIYGATILPFKESFYYSPVHETEREIVNDWIRHSNLFDGVIDFDAALRDPADTLHLQPEFDSGDHLHLNEAGYYKMGESIDVTLFH